MKDRYAVIECYSNTLLGTYRSPEVALEEMRDAQLDGGCYRMFEMMDIQ